ncbi:MAG: VWA domain-containing protein, partial [Polyangiaceae bacterium]|nr:VWA domain-containing protein [Polyangiaceae bacterium]
MSRMTKQLLWLLVCLVLTAGLAWLYYHFVWTAPASDFAWQEGDKKREFLAPRFIGVVLLAPWFVWLLGASLADLPWQQRALSVLLRIAFVVLLGLGLSRLVETASTDKICTVYMIDVSDSVTDEGLEDARAAVQTGFDGKRPDDLVRVVTFARRPRLVEAAEGSTDPPPIERHTDEAGARGELGAGSNLQAALQLAYGLYPAGYLRRAVLMSDGLQTDGDVLAEASRTARYGIKLYTLPFTRGVPAEVALRGMKMPSSVKIGETFEIHADVYASRATTARARLYQGEALNALDGVRVLALKAGANDVSFKSVVHLAGEVTYRLELDEIPADRFLENNRFASTIEVPGRPAVLYVEGSPQHAGPLARALTAQQFDVDVRPPAGFPATLGELGRYDFFVLSDTPKEAVSEDGQRLVEKYVRDLGGGFLFAGGENGYQLGGWQNTTIAKLLPVHMRSEDREETPSVAMVLVLDRSGSMTGPPIEMAKRAAMATVETLGATDVIEVIAFDSAPTRYVKFQPARNQARIRGQIARIQPGGGTEILPGLDMAYNDLTVTPARKKHVILLTDGKASSSGIREIVTAMIAESITVTTVGLGPDVDEPLLKMIADVGGGRYHPVPEAQNLPKIFTKETEMIAQAAAVEDWFPVAQSGYAQFLRGIDVNGAPYLHGYVQTKMKETPAVELLANPDRGEPILARWRVGTGWSLAWTSDVKTRWAVEWTTWPGWEKFWGQLVREHMREKSHRELDMRAEVVGGKLVASIDAFTV